MIEAAGGLVPIMVDCTNRGDHQDLRQRYSVRGFPTVLFLDSEGEVVERLNGRDPASVRRQIESVIEQYASPAFLEQSLEDGLEAARSAQKLLAVVYTDSMEERNSMALAAWVQDDQYAAVVERFHWIQRPISEGGDRTEEADGLRVRRSPTLVLIDPNAEEDDRVLDRVTSFRRLERELEKAIEASEE